MCRFTNIFASKYMHMRKKQLCLFTSCYRSNQDFRVTRYSSDKRNCGSSTTFAAGFALRDGIKKFGWSISRNRIATGSLQIPRTSRNRIRGGPARSNLRARDVARAYRVIFKALIDLSRRDSRDRSTYVQTWVRRSKSLTAAFRAADTAIRLPRCYFYYD